MDGERREQGEGDQDERGPGVPRHLRLVALFFLNALLLALVVHVLRLDLVVQTADGDRVDVRHEVAARGGDLAQPPDGVQQLLHVGVAFRRLLGHHLFDEGGDGRGQAGHEMLGRLGLLVEMLVRERADGDGAERERAGDHLVEGDAEAVDVAARVERLAGELLRAHVGRAAGDVHVLGPVLLVHGEAEVGELDDAVVGDHDVVGLHVAVDQAAFVPGVAESLGDLLDDVQRLVDRDALLAFQAGFQRFALDVGHCHVAVAVILADRVGLHEVDVAELGGGAGFVQERRHALFGHILVGQHLQRDLAFQRNLLRQEHDPGGPRPDAALDDEVADDAAVVEARGRDRDRLAARRAYDTASGVGLFDGDLEMAEGAGETEHGAVLDSEGIWGYKNNISHVREVCKCDLRFSFRKNGGCV